MAGKAVAEKKKTEAAHYPAAMAPIAARSDGTRATTVRRSGRRCNVPAHL